MVLSFTNLFVVVAGDGITACLSLILRHHLSFRQKIGLYLPR
jgi:hypothetical protein